MRPITFIKKITYVLLLLTSALNATDKMAVKAALTEIYKDQIGIEKSDGCAFAKEPNGQHNLVYDKGEFGIYRPAELNPPKSIIGAPQTNTQPAPQTASVIPKPALHKTAIDVIMKPAGGSSPSIGIPSLGVHSGATSFEFLDAPGPTNRGREQTKSWGQIRREHYNLLLNDEAKFKAGLEQQHANIHAEYEYYRAISQKLISAFKLGDGYAVSRCLIALEHASISDPVLNEQLHRMLDDIIKEFTRTGKDNFLTCYYTGGQIEGINKAYNDFVGWYDYKIHTQDYWLDLGDKVESVMHKHRSKTNEFHAEISKTCEQKPLHNSHTKKFFTCELYRSLVKINGLCEIGEFKKAFAEITRLHKKYPISSPAIQRYHEALYNKEYAQRFTPEGIQPLLTRDPFYQTIKGTASRTPNEAWNALLTKRKEAAEKTLAKIGRSKECNELTRNLAYELIDLQQKGNKRAEVEFLSKKLSNDHADPQVRESYNDYFYGSGVCKLTDCDPVLANFGMGQEIGNAKNHEKRMLVHDLATVSAHNPQIKDSVVKGFEYVKKSLADDQYSKAYETLARAITTALQNPKADQSVLQLGNYAAPTTTEAQQATQREAVLAIADLLHKMEKVTQESGAYQELLQKLYTHDELYKDVMGNAAIANAYLQEILKESTAIKPELIAKRFSEYYHWLQKRVAARVDIEKRGEVIDTQHYILEYQTKQYLQDTKVDINNFKTCLGDQLQRALHGEAIHVQGITAQQYYNQKAPRTSPYIQTFCAQTSHILNKATQYIKGNDTGHAAQLLDLAWNIQAKLDTWQEKLIAGLHSWNDVKNNPAAHKDAVLTGNPAIDADLNKHFADTTSTNHGFAHALINGLDTGTQIALHPLQTVISAEIMVRNAGNALGNFIGKVGNTFRKPPDEFRQVFERKAWETAKAVCDGTAHVLSDPHARGEFIGNAIVGWLTGKVSGYITRPLVNGAKRIKAALAGATESIVTPLTEIGSEVAVTAEGIEIRVANEGSNIAKMEGQIPANNAPKKPLPTVAAAAYDFGSHKNPLIRNFPATTYHQDFALSSKQAADHCCL